MTPRGPQAHTELPRVSAGYPLPLGRLATCSSPVRHVSGPKAAPFDLHALGTPPALILSQDQTLHHCLRRLTGSDDCQVAPPAPKGVPSRPRTFHCLLLAVTRSGPNLAPGSSLRYPPAQPASPARCDATRRLVTAPARVPTCLLLRLPHTTPPSPPTPPPKGSPPSRTSCLAPVRSCADLLRCL